MRLHLLRRRTGPAQTRSGWFSHQHAQIAGSAFRSGCQLLPILQPAGLLQPGREQIAREVDHLPSRQVPAQKLQTGFVELVRFVKDHRLHGRQQLRHTGLAHRQVGKEKMVVDHHHVRCKRLAPRLIDMAGAKFRTLRAQAILARRRYLRQQG